MITTLLLSFVLSWPPSAGGSDSSIMGGTTGGAFNSATLEAAINEIAEANPAMAGEIGAAFLDGSVAFVNLSPSSGPDVAGMADGNTVALDPSIDDLDALASTLAHEWHHVRQRNDGPDTAGEPDYLPDSCLEAYAYSAERAYRCALMNARASEAGDRPFACYQNKSVQDQYSCAADQCMADTGGYQVPTPPACSAAAFCS